MERLGSMGDESVVGGNDRSSRFRFFRGIDVGGGGSSACIVVLWTFSMNVLLAPILLLRRGIFGSAGTVRFLMGDIFLAA